MVLKYVYTVFIGVLLALFIGIGIAAFYPYPKAPEPSAVPVAYRNDLQATPSAQTIEQEKKDREAWQEYQRQNEEYNRNVSIMTLIAAIVVLVISLTLARSILIIADGLLLGGLFTLVYSLFRSFNSSDYKFMFIVISTGLAISVILGYLKFIKPLSRNK